jgi:opacity protein-like surface antigen
MKLIIKLLVISSIAIPSLVLAEEARPYYIELNAGFSNGYIPHNDGMPSGRYGGAAVSSIAFGRQFNDKLAFDLDLSYRGDFNNDDKSYKTALSDNATVSTSITSLSAMINGYYYYYNEYPGFRPYITGGVGLAMNKTGQFKMTYQDDNDSCAVVAEGEKTTSFAWKLGTGIKYQLNNNFEVDFRYQFVNLGNVKQKSSESSYYNGKYLSSENITSKNSILKSHEVLVGIVYKF